MNDYGKLTIRHAQLQQPWVLPLAIEKGRVRAPQAGFFGQDHHDGIDHFRASHAVLHAVKSVGKLASVFESLDHSGRPIAEAQRQDVMAMSADLVTIAMRFANLYKFDLATVLALRVEEKNGVPIPAWED